MAENCEVWECDQLERFMLEEAFVQEQNRISDSAKSQELEMVKQQFNNYVEHSKQELLQESEKFKRHIALQDEIIIKKNAELKKKGQHYNQMCRDQKLKIKVLKAVQEDRMQKDRELRSQKSENFKSHIRIVQEKLTERNQLLKEKNIRIDQLTGDNSKTVKVLKAEHEKKVVAMRKEHQKQLEKLKRNPSDIEEYFSCSEDLYSDEDQKPDVEDVDLLAELEKDPHLVCKNTVELYNTLFEWVDLQTESLRNGVKAQEDEKKTMAEEWKAKEKKYQDEIKQLEYELLYL